MHIETLTKALLICLVIFLIILILMLPMIIPMTLQINDDGNEYGSNAKSMYDEILIEHGPDELTPEKISDSNKKLNSENPTDDVLLDDELDLSGTTIANVDRPVPDKELPTDNVATFGSQVIST